MSGFVSSLAFSEQTTLRPIELPTCSLSPVLHSILSQLSGSENKHIEDFLRQGRLQEAVWEARAAGKNTLAEKILEDLREKLTTGQSIFIKSVRLIAPEHPGITGALLVLLNNGLQGIFKPLGTWVKSKNINAEIAAYKFSELLGANLVPLTIAREFNGKPGSFQYFIVNSQHKSRPLSNNMLFFDYLINIQDRHSEGKNWIVYDGSQEVAIDHGYCFF